MVSQRAVQMESEALVLLSFPFLVDILADTGGC